MDYPWLDEYCLSKKGAIKDFKAEWGWDRYLISGKMFAAVCTDMGGRPLFTVKCEPAFGQLLRNEYPDIIPGFYMNKIHWNSVLLQGNVPDDVIRDMINQSYRLVLQALPKKVQHELQDI